MTNCPLIVCYVESITPRSTPLPLLQIKASDIVVLNKCDLPTLGVISDVEDAVRQLAPHACVLRARFGQVSCPGLSGSL